jgi:hypothetical protein
MEPRCAGCVLADLCPQVGVKRLPACVFVDFKKTLPS